MKFVEAQDLMHPLKGHCILGVNVVRLGDVVRWLHFVESLLGLVQLFP